MKRIGALILTAIMVVGMTLLLSGCSGTADYTDYFSVQSISPVDNRTENLIEINYEVSNFGKKDDLVFCVSIDGNTKKYSVDPGSEKIDQVVIDIGRPKNYQLSYSVTYEVTRNGKSVWKKDDTIAYDCTAMFIHPATISYGAESVEVELTDYQSNFFDLSELFPEFNAEKAHNVDFKGEEKYTDVHTSKDDSFACIVLDETDEKGMANAATGSLLKLFTYGKQEINDSFHFSDNLEIQISDAIKAEDINWEEHMTFEEEAKRSTSTLYGRKVTTYTMYVSVDNPSSETIYGTVTNFYVNDKAIPDEYFTVGLRTPIDAKESDKLQHTSGIGIWESTGIKVENIEKFGMRIKIEDVDGNVLYDDIQWNYLD